MAVKDIAARAWEYRPTWKGNTFLLLAAGAAWLVLDLPLWTLAVAYLVGCVVICGTLGWIESWNERAEEEEAAEKPGEGEHE